MGKKIALNVLYTVGIVVSVFFGIEAYAAKHYSYIPAAAFVAIILIVLKVRLTKEVREMTRKK